MCFISGICSSCGVFSHLSTTLSANYTTRQLYCTTSVNVNIKFTSHSCGYCLQSKAVNNKKTSSKGSDTLESFLSKVAFESNLWKKLSRIEHVLIVKVYSERRKIAKVFMTHGQDFFRKSLSKENFLVCHYPNTVRKDKCERDFQKQDNNFDRMYIWFLVLFSALTLLVGQQEGHPSCKWVSEQ